MIPRLAHAWHLFALKCECEGANLDGAEPPGLESPPMRQTLHKSSPEPRTPRPETRFIRRALLKWFRREARDLPWRRTHDPYAVWLSEILLQQTRVEQGLPYYERFLKASPTVESLAAAPEQQVLKLWEGLGYYTRARNLHAGARYIVQDLGGRFPNTVEGWLKVPGVGRYTAGAIVSIAFDKPAPILDGNVKRVLSRLFDIPAPVEATATQQRLWSLAEELVPRTSPGDFNQAMMELGARICVPRGPLCGQCPIEPVCAARAAGTQEQRPVRQPAKPVPHYEVVVAVICRRGRYLLGRRPPDGLLGGLWEFPGGKVHKGETHEQALKREAQEELGITIQVGEPIAVVQHAYSHFRVTLNVYRCSAPNGNPRAKVHTELRWIPRNRLSEYPLPGANHRFLPLL